MSRKCKIRETGQRRCYTIEDCFFYTGCVLIVVGLVLIFVVSVQPEWMHQIKQLPCLFHMLTGYYCPGCGGTRAAAALLHGQILRSFYYHPIVIYGALTFGCFMITQAVEHFSRRAIPIGMRYRNGYVWTALVILVLNFLIKNTLHHFFGYTM